MVRIWEWAAGCVRGFLVDAWFLPSNRLLSHNPKSGSTIVCAPWFECFPSSPVKATARWKDPMFRSGSDPNRKPWIYHDLSVCVFDGPWTKEKWSSFPIQSNPFEIHEKSIKTLQNQVFHRFCTNIKTHNSQSAISSAKKNSLRTISINAKALQKVHRACLRGSFF